MMETTESVHIFNTKVARDIYQNVENCLIALRDLKDSNSTFGASPVTTLNGAESVKKFESLCRGIVSSVQELSLRIAKLSETDLDIRPIAAECRKVLLEVSTSLMLATSTSGPNGPKSPGHIRRNTFPALVESTLPLLTRGCQLALTASEQMNAKKVREMGEPVFQTLSHLQRCQPENDDLFLTVKIFGIRLLKFLDVCSTHHRDLVLDGRKNLVIAQADTVKKLAPYLIQSLKDSLRRPGNVHLRDCREFFFNATKKTIDSLIRNFEQKPDEENLQASDDLMPAGSFVKHMDQVLEGLSNYERNSESLDRIRDISEWLIRFALSVSKSCPRDEVDIFDACRNVVSELEELKSGAPVVEGVKESLESMEHAVNVALLRLIVSTFSRSHHPLDVLIQDIVAKQNRGSKIPDEIVEMIKKVDDNNDDLFHAAHFSRFCATDKKKSLQILSCLKTLEILEKELVPSCQRLFFHPQDVGARSHLRVIRSFWKAEFDTLEATILDIVDATALCAVIEEEARTIAIELKKHPDDQDLTWLRSIVTRLIRMCQMGADAAWKECSDGDNNVQLPETHPVIKLERSSWEVNCALSQVISVSNNIDTQRALLRRVQLLAISMSNVVKYLVSRNEKSEDDLWQPSKSGNVIERSSSVRVLTSVSRVTIGSPIVSEMSRRKRAQSFNRPKRPEISRLGTRSFRLSSVPCRDEKQLKHHTTVFVDDTMTKLTALTPKLPFSTRKTSSQIISGAKLELARSFDLSNILNSPRLPPEGEEKPTKNFTSFNYSRSPLRVITNCNSFRGKSQFSKKNLTISEFTKCNADNATNNSVELQIDMLLKTA